MLKDILLSYEQVADSVVPGWRDMNKNDLVNRCVDAEGNKTLYDGYISAIVARYWPLATKFYYQNSSSVTPEECYGWLLDSILYILDKKQWRDPTKAVYNDPNGPDKVINRCMISARLMFYQASNCISRRINYQLYSADGLQEELGDAAFPAIEDDNINRVSDMSDELVIRAFSKKDYFSCAVIDNIAHKDTYDVIKEGKNIYTKFNPKKLAKVLRQCGDEYCDKFSRKYNVDVSEMKTEVSKIKQFSSEKMYRWINRSLQKLRDNKNIQEMFV